MALTCRPAPSARARAQIFKSHEAKNCKTCSASLATVDEAELLALCSASNTLRAAREKLSAPSAYGVAAKAYKGTANDAAAALYAAGQGYTAAPHGDGARAFYKWVSGFGFRGGVTRVLVVALHSPS